ncbi:MAG: FecR domain-containing protein [Planctomycetota bacterium]|nr:FecR domain-containing protein [Planctomycetota bacterium]
MTEPLKDDEREVLLSMYIDGELDAERRQAVEAKLRDDPAWKADYDALTDSDKRVSKVVQESWHDPEFTGRVMDRITREGLPAAPAWAGDGAFPPAVEPSAGRKALKDHRVRLLISLAAVASLSLFAMTLWFAFRTQKPLSNPLPKLLAKVQPEDVRLEMDLGRFKGYVPGNVHLGQNITVKSESTLVRWEDGTRLWLRQDACIRAAGLRSMIVVKGRFLIDVARSAEPFTLTLADDTKLQVLGTRFEVDAGASGIRVRVLEGVVRRDGGTIQAPALARGGEEIAPDGRVSIFDPRELSTEWSSLAGQPANKASGLPAVFAAPWPQLGGNPGHTGVTPLAGPAGLAATRFLAFPPSAGPNSEESSQYAPAVVGAGGRAYVLRRAGANKMQLYGVDLEASGEPDWKPCGEPLSGNAQYPPVITAHGLVVAGASGNTVQAWDPEKNAVAWKVDAESNVFALCASYDGNIYCSTFKRLLVLNEKGEKAWAYPNITDLQAPAAVGPDGTALIIARDGKAALLSREGKLLEMLEWPGVSGENIFWPPVSAAKGFLAVTTSGRLAQQGESAAGAAKAGELTEWPTDGRRLTTAPVTTGADAATWYFASANRLMCGSATGPKPLLDLPTAGDVVALGYDGNRLLYAGAKNALYRVDLKEGKLKDFAAAKKGEIVRGGIAVLAGRVVVTTTEGLQIFE